MEQYKDEKAFLAEIGENNNDFVFLQELPELLNKYYLFKTENQGSDIKEVALAILENQLDIAEWNVSPSLKKAALISIMEFSNWYKAYLIEQAKKGKLTFQECKDEVAKKYLYKNWDSLALSEKLGIQDIISETYANQFIPVAPAEQWISVKDRLPEIDNDVLLYSKREYEADPGVILGWRQKDYLNVTDFASLHTREDEDLFVSHWMPLPAAPESTTLTKQL